MKLRPRLRVVAALGALLGVGCQPPEAEPDRAPSAGAPPEVRDAPGVLYGRIGTYSGSTYEGRLRWGGDEEAFWGDPFDGVKDDNPWARHTPLGESGGARRPTTVFGIELPWGRSSDDLSRPFMARFGDIARIEAVGDGVRGLVEEGAAFDPEVRVTLKSGTVVRLDRLASSDFDDGVRVWDERRGVVDLSPREIRSVEFLPTPPLAGVPDRLYGTVRTRQRAFTGYLRWDRQASVETDVLVGDSGDVEVGVPFREIQSLIRETGGGVRVTRHDGRGVVLTGTRATGRGHRGVDVDDPRVGWVSVSWEALERVELAPAGSGPGYNDFPPGRPLRGVITTRDGRRLPGRLVYDLDESETTETLDAPAMGVDYRIPFARIAAVDLARGERAHVTLQSGETLDLDLSGDLGAGNAGVLVFPASGPPAYVPWAEVNRIVFDVPTVEDR